MNSKSSNGWMFIFVLVFSIVLLLFGVAHADDFTLHSDVKFGMSLLEVTEAEAANDFNVYVGFLGETVGGFKKGKEPIVDRMVEQTVGNVDQNMIAGSIAGYDGSYIYYDFENDKLTTAIYHFGSKNDSGRFIKLTEALEAKYGMPMDIKGTLIQFPAHGKTAVHIINLCRFNDMIDISIRNIKEWLVPVDNGYVSIYAIAFSYPSGGEDEVVISYQFFTNVEFEEFMKQQDAAIQKQLEDETRRESELANDL